MTQKAGVNFKEIKKDSYVCLLPKGHPFESKEILSIKELKDEPIVVCNPLDVPLSTARFQQQLLKIHSRHNVLYCNSVEIAHCMVSAGLGVSILPSMLCLKSPDFSTVSLEDNTQISFGVLYHKQIANATLEKFLTLL